ncbi:MAG TPA: DnaJ domain-containing protein, partial [Novosphingobium sp.]
MVADGSFVDYYAIMGVTPDCDAVALEAAFRLLAKRYHPDHVETADVERFGEVVEAYKTLKNPDRRAQYDGLYARTTGFRFAAAAAQLAEEDAAL